MSGLPAARALYPEDLAALCEIDVANVRRSLESRSASEKTAVAILPDIETIQWHHAREDFVGIELYGKTPKVKGAIVGKEKGKRVWCYWTRMYQNPTEVKGNTLHILRLVIEDAGWEKVGTRQANGELVDHSHDAAIAALLVMAQREAAEWKMENVDMWAPSPAALAAVQRLDPGAKVIHRDHESIASLQWFPEHDGPVVDKIDWIGNEKYGWC